MNCLIRIILCFTATTTEIFDIGYEEYMFSGEYCFLEWPEMVETILPEETVRIALSVVEGGMRELQELG